MWYWFARLIRNWDIKRHRIPYAETPEEEKIICEQLKVELQRLENPSLIGMTIIASLIIGFPIGTFYFSMSLYELRSRIAISIIIGLFFALFTSFFLINQKIVKQYDIRKKIIALDSNIIKEKLEDDLFTNSVQMSYKYLDQYYLQTRQQAENGFRVTIFVAGFGALLLFAGIVAMFLGLTNPAYVTCASGAVTELIAAVFFYLYNKTVFSMTNYHNKLVLSQNISIALRVADSLPEAEKTQAKSTIVTELMKNVNAYLIKSDTEAASSTPAPADLSPPVPSGTSDGETST